MKYLTKYLWIALIFPLIMSCWLNDTTCPVSSPRIWMKEYTTILVPPFDSTLVSCDVYKVDTGDEFGPLTDEGRHLFKVNRILSRSQVEITYDSTLYVQSDPFYDPPSPVIISYDEVRFFEKIIGVSHEYRLSVLK
ncbi:MAG: hypothetical protein JXB45_04440 [Candidatus Krumholzibacteriota bacterium]|nr:hypothetical protein [Candidatus Krumholzibacteriota bacterium]